MTTGICRSGRLFLGGHKQRHTQVTGVIDTANSAYRPASHQHVSKQTPIERSAQRKLLEIA